MSSSSYFAEGASHADVLLVNQLLGRESDKDADRLDLIRVLWFEPGSDRVVTISVGDTTRGMPEWTTRGELIDAIGQGTLVPVTDDPSLPSAFRDDDLTAAERRIRDTRWNAIRPLVEDPESLVLYPQFRNQCITDAHEKTGCSRAHLYRWLRLYWQRGQSKNALLPNLANCGAPGGLRTPGRAKRGRPRSPARAALDGVGINVDPDLREKIIRGIRAFADGKGMSVSQAYEETMTTIFSVNGETIIAPPDERPSLEQFKHIYYQVTGRAGRALSRFGQRRYNLKFRPALGSTAHLAYGPGSLYQIDATVGDIYLVSSVIPGRVIGRPVIYMVRDAFSRMIVGLYIGLEGPSWLGMMMALENAFTSKVEFCAKYGFEITDEEWPAQYLCETLLGDRGELISRHADQLANAFPMRISNTGSWRADLKGIVENGFKNLNDEVIHLQPGAVHDLEGRGAPDYRLDAKLTLYHFTRMIVGYVLYDLRVRPVSDEALPEGFPIPTGGNPTPLELWRWGVRHRSGHLQSMARDRVRANLLPSETVRVSARGIRLFGLHYEPIWPEEMELTSDHPAQNWFVRDGQGREEMVTVAYDPRDTTLVYLRYDRGRTIVPCRLLPRDRRYTGMTFAEARDARSIHEAGKKAAKSERLQADIDLHAFQASVVAEANAQAPGLTRKTIIPTAIREAQGTEREQRRSEEIFRLSSVDPALYEVADESAGASGNSDHTPITHEPGV